MLGFILFLVIGALAGFLAGKIMKGRSYGLLINMLLGIVGAYLGGFLFRLIGIAAYGLIGELVTATVGAVVVIWLAGVISKKK